MCVMFGGDQTDNSVCLNDNTTEFIVEWHFFGLFLQRHAYLDSDVIEYYSCFLCIMSNPDVNQLDSMLSYVANRDGNRPPSFFDKGICYLGYIEY